MHIVAIVLGAILGIAYVIVGFMKFGGKEPVESFKHYGYSDGFRILVGILEILGGVWMIIGIWSQWVAILAGPWIAVIMVGAMITQIRAKNEVKEIMLPVPFLILALAVSVINLVM
ncbi:DoxX family protein [Paenibacillus terreus]|uniref:DoxX family protein n=1 Tax=Paenibacillus terreus TaxID=1387834 RepID=UPI0035CD1BA7